MATTGLELLWIPLGAEGSRLVRGCGRLYERGHAGLERRPPCDLYHAALRVRADQVTTYTVEVGPAWGNTEADRGVVRTGPVGARALGRFALFRYEVRCWRGGVIPDADAAVPGPLDVPTDQTRTALLLAKAADVPGPGVGAGSGRNHGDVELQLGGVLAPVEQWPRPAGTAGARPCPRLVRRGPAVRGDQGPLARGAKGSLEDGRPALASGALPRDASAAGVRSRVMRTIGPDRGRPDRPSVRGND